MRGFDMITLIMGGSGSGKSAYAEDYALAQAGESSKYYIATMQIYDAEGQRKVERHRKLRAGKGADGYCGGGITNCDSAAI